MERTAPSNPPSDDDAAVVARLRDARTRVREEMAKVVVGQEAIIDHLLVGLLCRGHILLLGVPGVGKTLMSRTLARTLELEFRRIQFTPDLMPSDITGMDIIEEDPATGRRKLEFFPGPIFANFLLADENNSTPPKTQAALLQAMQEHAVTAAGQTYRLPEPFFVLATQNPIEQEGTYPLPEAQLDRFMFELRVGYPTREEEERIVASTTGDTTRPVSPVLSAAELSALQHLVRRLPAPPTVVKYAVQLVRATRPDDAEASAQVKKYVSWGAGPRASQYLVLGAKARAAMDGRAMPDLDDVRSVALAVLRHRIVINFQGEADGMTVERVLALADGR
jgi:MoxR-like ATPase